MAAYFPLAPEPLAYGVWVFPREVFGQSGKKTDTSTSCLSRRPKRGADADLVAFDF